MSALQPNHDPAREPTSRFDPGDNAGCAPVPGTLRDSPYLPPVRRLRVSLGRTVITPNAASVLPDEDVVLALHRHATGDWGNLCAEDYAANDGALVHGTRLLSSYRSKAGIVFWIITEADRSLTTILLPEDY